MKKIIFASVAFIGYIALVLYKHFRFAENEFYYYPNTEGEVIGMSTFVYLLITSGIFFVYITINRIINERKEYSHRINEPIKNKEQDNNAIELLNGYNNTSIESEDIYTDDNNKCSKNSCNTILLVCIVIWVFYNIMKIVSCVPLIGIDGNIEAKYNIFIGILNVITLTTIAKGNKYGLFAFVLLQIINGAIISQIENNYIHMAISIIMICVMLLLLLLKNKEGKNGYYRMFGK